MLIWAKHPQEDTVTATATIHERIYDELNDGAMITFTGGRIMDADEGVIEPSVFVNMNEDDEFEIEDIQVDGAGWELVELNGDGVHGPVSYVSQVTDEMVRHVIDHPGVYVVAPVDGIAPEWTMRSDYTVGWALVRFSGNG